MNTFFAPNLGDEGVFGLEPDPFESHRPGPEPFSPFSGGEQQIILVNQSVDPEQGNTEGSEPSPSISPNGPGKNDESPIALAYKEAQQDSAYSDSCIASPYGSLSPPQCLLGKQSSPITPSSQIVCSSSNSCFFATAGSTLTVNTNGLASNQCSVDTQAKFLQPANPEQLLTTGNQFIHQFNRPPRLSTLPSNSRQFECKSPSDWFRSRSAQLSPFQEYGSGYHAVYPPSSWHPYNTLRPGLQIGPCRLPPGAQQYYTPVGPGYWGYNNPEFPPASFDLPDITSDSGLSPPLIPSSYSVYTSTGYPSGCTKTYTLLHSPRQSQQQQSAQHQLPPAPYAPPQPYQHPGHPAGPSYQALLQQQQQQAGVFLHPRSINPNYLRHQHNLSHHLAPPPHLQQAQGKMEDGTSPSHSDSMDSEDLALSSLAPKQPAVKRKPPQAEKSAKKPAKKQASKAPKKKKKKDPNEPQKPVSAYALFFRDTQAAIKSQNPTATFGEVSKIVASLWDNLDEDTKNEYKSKTEEAKKEYLQKLAAYRASLVSKGAHDSGSTSETSPTKPGPGPAAPVIEPIPDIVEREGSFTSSGSNRSEEEAGKNGHQHELGPPTLLPQTHDPAMYSMEHEQSSFPDLMHKPKDEKKHLYQPQPQENVPLTAIKPDNFYSKSIKSPCTRSGCPLESVPSPKWNNDYCSTDCVVEHCRDVFNSWVAAQSSGVSSSAI